MRFRSMTLSSARQRRRIELRFVQVGDVDAERLERLFRQVLLPQADQRHVVARRVEPRDHPGEEPLHAVHARALPAEVIADLQDVQLATAPRRGSRAAAPGLACRRSAPGCRPRSPRPAPPRARPPPAPTTARSPIVTPSRIFAPAPSHAPAPMSTPADRRACVSTGRDGSPEIVVAADHIAVGRDERVAADAHAARRKHLAVEPDVRPVVRARCRRSCTTGWCCGR